MGSEIIDYILRPTELPSMVTYHHGVIHVGHTIEAILLTGKSREEAEYVITEVTADGSIVAMATPEARSLYTGLIGWNDRELGVIPSRLHLGRLRELDSRLALYHLFQVLLQAPETSSLLQPPYDDIAVVGIPRESYAYDIRSLKDLIGSFPYDTIQASHVWADNPIGRTTKITPPKLEGFHKERIKRLIVVDSIASGLNQGAVIEYLLFCPFPANPVTLTEVDTIIMLAPHASLLGSLALIHFCHDKGIRSVIGCFGGTLNSDEQRYYSPLSCDEPHRMADSRDLELHKRIMRDMAKYIGVGGNWTANYLALEVALADLGKFLARHNLTVDDLRRMAPTIHEVSQIYGGDSSALLTYSTYREAMKRFGNIGIIDELLSQT